MAPEDEQLGQSEDGQLVRLAREGCQAAFNELVRRYRAGVYLMARQIVGDAGWAEDVTQEALLIALRALPTLTDPARFGPWLGAITRNRARRVARQEDRFVPLEPAHIENLPSPTASAPDGLADAFAELGEEYRTVLRLRYWEEWSVGQIAAFLSLPLTTIKWRLHFARELLRRRLSRPEKEEEDHGNVAV